MDHKEFRGLAAQYNQVKIIFWGEAHPRELFRLSFFVAAASHAASFWRHGPLLREKKAR